MSTNCDTSRNMPEDVIFALDIGTRTIIGLVGEYKDERFVVHAIEIVTHENRAMLDGQIHDISKVVQGAKKVKESLENKLGYRLTKVAVAAAGRVLKTCQVKVEREIEEGKEIDLQLISTIEMEAIQNAQLQLENRLKKDEKEQYYCVGYSVVSYYLNDYVISSLQGHKGHKAGVEVLATFLPQTVVDSLYTVMELTNLEVTHLTLEPIAALNLAIPKDLRLLNLALVDVGAGTSDIAITRSGTIVAYSMVPIAGDEITEVIAQHYLVDFNTAETIKITLSNSEDTVTFTDILDNSVTVKRQEINEVIKPTVEQLARIISEKILEFNGGKAPNAIFLVGGGSQTSGLCEEISNCIGLPKDRVAIRTRSIAKNIDVEENVLKGPESITPLGILVTTYITKGQDFYYVMVNGNKVRMYNSRKMSVSDALIITGFNPEQLICKSGKHLKFNLNGNSRTVRGGLGKPAEIYVNNAPSGLNTIISPGDEVTVIPAEKGNDGFARVSDLLEEIEPVFLKYNDNTCTVMPRASINGVNVSYDTVINEGDMVQIVEDRTLEDIAKLYEMDPLIWQFEVNGNLNELDTSINPGDKIVARPKRYENKPSNDENVPILPTEEYERSKDEAAVTSTIQSLPIETDNKLMQNDGIVVNVNGKEIRLPPKNTNYIFIDVFNHIDFDLTEPKGSIVLRLNGREANYVDIIKTGDIIDIYWRE